MSAEKAPNQFLELAISCISDLVWQWVPGKDALVWHGDIVEALGVNEESASSWKLLRRRLHPDDLQRIDNQLEDLCNEPRDFERVYRILHADGRYRHWVDRGRYWPSHDCFVGAVSDVTGQHAVEKGDYLAALRRSESQFRTLVENIPGAAYRCLADEHWTMQYISQGIENLTGYPGDEFINNRVRSFTSIIHPDDRARVDSEVHHAISDHASFLLEYRIFNAEGEIVWFWERGTGIYDAAGELDHLEGVFYDLTERKRAEDNLRRSEERFDLAMQGASDGLYDWNLVSNEIYYSPRWKSMLGYTDDELPNRFSTWEDLVDVQDLQKSWEMLTDYIEGRRDNFQLEFKMRHKDGHWVDILSRALLVRDDRGMAVRVVGTHVDISERIRKEAENVRLQRQLEQAHKMEALGQLTGGVAHDFNNMLAIVLGFTELAQMPGAGDEKRTGYLLQVEKAALRAKRMVTQMLAFSRGVSESSRPLQLLTNVRDDLELLRSTLPATIRIETDLTEGLPLVAIHPVQLNQVLMNLCLNAKDAMQGEGVLQIGLHMSEIFDEVCASSQQPVRGTWVELSVSDTGCGIAADVYDRMFEPFFSTKAVGKGSGMGLSVIHGILKSHSGHVVVETRHGRGTKFRILLPPAAAEASVAREATSTLKTLQQGSGERLMVIDDEVNLAEYLGELLELNGYTVEVLVDSREALRRFLQHPDDFALLITDQTMPHLSGIDLLQKVRAVRPSLPAILCTGYSEAVTGTDAETLGIEYLGKPVDNALLLSKIKRILTPDC